MPSRVPRSHLDLHFNAFKGSRPPHLGSKPRPRWFSAWPCGPSVMLGAGLLSVGKAEAANWPFHTAQPPPIVVSAHHQHSDTPTYGAAHYKPQPVMASN